MWVSGTSRSTWSSRSGGVGTGTVRETVERAAAAAARRRRRPPAPRRRARRAAPPARRAAARAAPRGWSRRRAGWRGRARPWRPWRRASSAAVLGRDARRGELAGQRRAAHEERDLDAGRAQVLGGDHHLLGRLHQEPGQPEGVRLVAVVRGDQLLGRHLDAEVDDPVAVVLEDDLDEVLADVVDVALDGGEHDACRGWRSRPSP